MLPADLPELSAGDVASLARVARAGGVAVAPDWRGEGTNGLAFPIGHAPRFQFGAGSFNAHRAAAIELGLEPVIVRSPGLAHDVDDEPSLARLRGVGLVI